MGDIQRVVSKYDPARMLVFAVDLPVAGQVIRASRTSPYLCFVLTLEAARVAELAARVATKDIARLREEGFASA